MGTSSTSTIVSRNNADAVSPFQSNNANASSTGHLGDFQNQGSNKSGFVNNGTPFYVIGTALTASSTITPLTPTAHIGGSGSITSITVPTGCEVAASGSGCIIHFIVDSGSTWNFTTGGNIAKACTTAPAVSSMVSVQYDPTPALWYPSCQ